MKLLFTLRTTLDAQKSDEPHEMQRISAKLLWLTVLGLSAVTQIAHSEIYKSVDEQGRTHYSDKPYATNAVEMQVKRFADTDATSPPIMKERLERQQRLLEVWSEERREKREKRGKKETEKRKRKKACRRLRNIFKDLERVGRAYYFNDEGERVYLDDETRRSWIEKGQSTIAKYCR